MITSSGVSKLPSIPLLRRSKLAGLRALMVLSASLVLTWRLENADAVEPPSAGICDTAVMTGAWVSPELPRNS